MDTLEIKELTVNYFGHSDCIHSVSHEFHTGINVLFGTEGAGKTSLLMSVCGLVKPKEGEVLFNGKPLSLGKEGEISVVFGDLGLFERRSLKYNMCYPLKLRGFSKNDCQQIARQWCKRFELTDNLFSVKAFRLASDERVKAALARAFYRKPKIILLDNPLKSLSPTDRRSMFIKLFSELAIADAVVLYATDDPWEAMALNMPTMVLSYGYKAESGTPSEFKNAPETLFTAKSLIPFFNVFSATISKGKLCWQFGEQVIDTSGTLAGEYVDKEVILGFCPQAVIQGDSPVSCRLQLSTEQGAIYILEGNGKLFSSHPFSGISLASDGFFLFDANNERLIFGNGMSYTEMENE